MGQAGVYKIVNLVSGKLYIGGTINLQGRRACHFYRLRRGDHFSRRLQEDFNRYGAGNFKFVVIEAISNLSELREREQYYLNLYDATNEESGYNTHPLADSPLGSKRSDEDRLKMSQSRKGDKHWNYGKRRSEETRRKMSLSKKGKYMGPNSFGYGRHRSESTKKKIGAAMKGKYSGANSSVAIAVINLDTGQVYPTLTEAARLCSVNLNSLCAVCKGKRKKAGGCRWMYYNDYLQIERMG